MIRCRKRPPSQRRQLTRNVVGQREPADAGSQELPTRSILDASRRQVLVGRFRRLRPDTPARWGRMTAPQMVTHLSDQIRHTLGDTHAAQRPGPLRWPLIKQAALYWVPWPKGRIQGPPEAFVTRPTTWPADLAGLEALIERFVAQDDCPDWPEHPFFGPMSRRAWGCFCYRHFDYHLRQFGA